MRFRASGQKPAFAESPATLVVSSSHNFPHSPGDLWLARLSFAAQIGTLALAIIGYFYVVIPLYSKAVLEEQIAKKELELADKDKKTKTLETDIANQQRELAIATNAVEQQKSRLRQLEHEAASQGQALKSTRNSLSQVAGELSLVQRDLSVARTESLTNYAKNTGLRC